MNPIATIKRIIHSFHRVFSDEPFKRVVSNNTTWFYLKISVRKCLRYVALQICMNFHKSLTKTKKKLMWTP